MKTIAMVANTSWSMIKFRSGIIKRLLHEGYRLYIIAPYDHLSDQLIDMGCIYIDVTMNNKGTNIFSDLRYMRQLYRLYKEIQPDLIFHYTIKPNIYGTLAAKKAKIKSVAVITGLGYTFINDNITAKAAKFLYKISLKHATQVWFINTEDRNKFLLHQLVPKEKIEQLPSEGINTDHFRPIKIEKKNGDFHFILIARLLWDKGVGEYVKAAKELRKKYPHIICQLLGFVDAQNPQAISQEQIDFWEEKKYVKYLGTTEDVRPFIAQSDCVVLPSYREGMSMILLESASMAKPIIATNVPGCRDLVNHHISGYLCNPRDYHDLMQKMEKMILTTEEEREKMGMQGREIIISEYNEQTVIEKYLRTIKSLVSTESHFRLKYHDD